MLMQLLQGPDQAAAARGTPTASLSGALLGVGTDDVGGAQNLLCGAVSSLQSQALCMHRIAPMMAARQAYDRLRTILLKTNCWI